METDTNQSALKSATYDLSSVGSNFPASLNLNALEKRVVGLLCVIKTTAPKSRSVVGCAFGPCWIITSSQVFEELGNDVKMTARFIVDGKPINLSINEQTWIHSPWAAVPTQDDLGYAIAEVVRSKEATQVFARAKVSLSENPINVDWIIAVTGANGNPSFLSRQEYPHHNPLPKGAVQIGVDQNNNLNICALYVGFNKQSNWHTWISARMIERDFAEELDQRDTIRVSAALLSRKGCENYMDGRLYFNQGNYGTAIRELTVAIEMQFLPAKYWLMLCHKAPKERDKRKNEDRRQAKLDLKVEPAQANANVLTNLGLWNLYGIGTEVDEEKSFHYFYEAARKGDAQAHRLLADCYAVGWGCKKSAEKAVRYWRLATEKDDVPSYTSLGERYECGIGMEEIDKQKAFECYLNGANRGSDEAMTNLVRCYENGIGVKKDQKEADIWRQVQRISMSTKKIPFEHVFDRNQEF